MELTVLETSTTSEAGSLALDESSLASSSLTPS
jgi:hypothetical protein